MKKGRLLLSGAIWLLLGLGIELTTTRKNIRFNFLAVVSSSKLIWPPKCGFTLQLVEHRTSIGKVTCVTRATQNDLPSLLSSRSSLIFSVPLATSLNSALLLSVRTLEVDKISFSTLAIRILIFWRQPIELSKFFFFHWKACVSLLSHFFFI